MSNAIEPYPSPKRSRAQAKPKPQGIIADPHGRLRKRIEGVAGQLIDAAERIVERIAAPPPPDPISVATHRRQFANTLSTWRFCASKTCRRSQCCRRDPLDCLHSVLPLMPDTLIGVLKMRRPKRRA